MVRKGPQFLWASKRAAEPSGVAHSPQPMTAAEILAASKERQARLLRKMVRKVIPEPRKCDSCARMPLNRKRLHVDHDHATGAFRGYLCHACNVCAGLMRDDPKRLRMLARYLSR